MCVCAYVLLVCSADTATATLDPTGLTTTEAGDTVTFIVVLDSQPDYPVTIALVSSDEREGSVSVPSLQFTVNSWNTAQIVTVTGVDDDQVDGDFTFFITTGVFVSADNNFNNGVMADVAVTNTDRK
jgi:hypothetical protein